ncbi:hypothetical protein D3C78_1791340 [compost metagenome]
MNLIAGGLLAGVEHPVGAHLTTGHPCTELAEAELAPGQGDPQIDGAEIQPLHSQAAQLQAPGQIEPFEGAQVRLHR